MYNSKLETNTQKSKPTFIGIGPPKCATTWLDSILRRHPDVFLPVQQKEVFYFDRFYDRGDDWYCGLFDGAADRPAIGEISTSYILDVQTVQRIRDFNPEVKLICILRNPVDRMVSHYRMFVENGRTDLDFENAVARHPELRMNSSYAGLLGNVLSIFPRDQIHLGIFEELFASPQATSSYLESLFDYIGVDQDRLAPVAVKQKVRETYGKPKSRWLVKKAKAIRSAMRKRDMEHIVQFLMRAGINRRLFLQPSEMPDIPDHLRRELIESFQNDVSFVERLHGGKIEVWHE